jgi:hypothetical protein
MTRKTSHSQLEREALETCCNDIPIPILMLDNVYGFPIRPCHCASDFHYPPAADPLVRDSDLFLFLVSRDLYVHHAFNVKRA